MNFAAFIDSIRQFGAQTREAWGQLSANGRVVIVGVGLLVAIPILLVTFRGSEARYITLSDNLNAQQIAESIALLEQRGIPYKLDETARKISVLPKDRGAMLLELEQNNLPVGAVVPNGFEEHDATDFGPVGAIQNHGGRRKWLSSSKA